MPSTPSPDCAATTMATTVVRDPPTVGSPNMILGLRTTRLTPIRPAPAVAAAAREASDTFRRTISPPALAGPPLPAPAPSVALTLRRLVTSAAAYRLGLRGRRHEAAAEAYAEHHPGQSVGGRRDQQRRRQGARIQE